MQADTRDAIRRTAQIAYRDPAALNEQDVEAVLITLIEAGNEREAALANAQLFHLRKQREAQMILSAEINGLSRKPEAR